jgi:hypothetical protein
VVRGIYGHPGAAYKTEKPRLLAELSVDEADSGLAGPQSGRKTRLRRAGRQDEQGFVKAWLEKGALMPENGIYRAILWVLALTVVAGALLAIWGETAAHDPVMVRVGAGAALVAGIIYACFRRLGAKQSQRRGDSDE